MSIVVLSARDLCTK